MNAMASLECSRLVGGRQDPGCLWATFEPSLPVRTATDWGYLIIVHTVLTRCSTGVLLVPAGRK
jgi:hypothetical protein